MTQRIARVLAMLVTLLLVLEGAVVGVPRPVAAQETDVTIFDANFDSTPTGLLTVGTPLSVNVGSVVATALPVAIVTGSNVSGRALEVSGSSTGSGVAELRFADMPTSASEVRIQADFTAGITSVNGAQIELRGGDTFELFRFGNGGQLTRGGSAVGLAYATGSVVRLDATLNFAQGTADITLMSGGSSVDLTGISLPGGLTFAVLDHLRVSTESFEGEYTIDDVTVVAAGDDDDDNGDDDDDNGDDDDGDDDDGDDDDSDDDDGDDDDRTVCENRRVFTASFDDAPVGVLTVNTELDVDLGSVVATSAPVAIVTGAGVEGQALAVDGSSAGSGSALLRFRNYPDGIPNAANSRRFDLRIQADFTADTTDVAGATVGLELEDGTFFELFTFGANGVLTRNGQSLNITYTAGSRVELDAGLQLNRGTLLLKLESGGSEIEVSGIDIPSAFEPRSLNQLRFETEARTGAYTIDNVAIRVECVPRDDDDDDDDDDGPPAVIVIDQPDVNIEVINNITFVNFEMTINNIGGEAENVVLVIDADDQLELADLSFLEGIGYVVNIVDGQILIGLGQNNVVIKEGKLKLKFKFKLKFKGGKEELKIKLDFKLRYEDSAGLQEVDALTLDTVIPPAEIVPVLLGSYPRLSVDRIDIRFRGRWERGGGLRIYGLPLTEAIVLESGIVVQYFERMRFEYHPELAGTEFEVLLGLLAVELGYREPPLPAPDADDPDAEWYFVPTGHYIAPPFRTFWLTQGGLLTFGYPIGAAFQDENGRLVQYFERTKLELHPELAGTEYEILLGFLGERVLILFGLEGPDERDDDDIDEPVATPTPEVTATATPEVTATPEATPTASPTPSGDDDDDNDDDDD